VLQSLLVLWYTASVLWMRLVLLESFATPLTVTALMLSLGLALTLKLLFSTQLLLWWLYELGICLGLLSLVWKQFDVLSMKR
jgi:hypothetical protein